VLTNGSAEGVAKPALTSGGAIQLIKGPLLDINMAQVGGQQQSCSREGGRAGRPGREQHTSCVRSALFPVVCCPDTISQYAVVLLPAVAI
jgi:hypothetical protein